MQFISLAISEAFAGSDVSGVKTFAKKTEDGKFFRYVIFPLLFLCLIDGFNSDLSFPLTLISLSFQGHRTKGTF